MAYLKKSSRKYAKKRTTTRRKTHSSRKVTHARRPRVMPVRVSDTTVEKLNIQKIKPIYVKKMMTLNPIGANGTTNVTGFQLTNSAALGTNFTFDPAGVLGNAGFGASYCGIQEWSSYSGLYQFYKVNKIKLIFSAFDTGSSGLLNASPQLLIRYNNDYVPISPSRSTMASMPGVIKKTFTPEHPLFEYSFYPKVQLLVDNYGQTLGNESRQPRKMSFTNTATPVQLYGISIYVSSIATGMWLNMDIEYDISFKSQY